MYGSKMILYRKFIYDDIIEDVDYILTDRTEDDEDTADRMAQFAGRLIELAAGYGYRGDLWQAYLTLVIASNENAYSRSCEMKGDAGGTLRLTALHDFSIFREMFRLDIGRLDRICGTDHARYLCDYRPEGEGPYSYNKRIRDRIMTLRDRLAEAAGDEDFADCVAAFYREFGVGDLGLNKAFRIDDGDGSLKIVPITNIMHVSLDDLVGYESAKAKLIANTEAFLEGRPCNNCLLFGDAGTGKSSCIKGIMNRYYERGLRIIEIYRHQFRYLNEVISQIKSRNYRFIIYMDDLSFEDYETEYKYLKAVIEGGLEKKPSNILIYATSNRRHIVREKYSDKEDRDDDLHTNDTVQEKLSLAYRFGETIFFARPDKKQFEQIVKTLADRYGVRMDEEELLLEANRWELSHGGLSGRTAQQFIDHLLGCAADK